MAYQAPVRDHAFLLRDVLKIENHANLPGFADAPMDLVEQILDGAAQFTGEVLAPLNSGRRQERLQVEPRQHGGHPARLQGRL
jgi:hypothetical protein